MKDQRDMTINFDLLGKFLAGEASPEEAIEVDEWILQSTENRKLFEQVSASWKGIALQSAQTGRVTPPATGQPDQFAAIPGIGQSRVIPLKFRKWWIGMVASLLIVCASLFLLFKISRHKAADLPPSDMSSSDNISFLTRQAGGEIITDTLPDRSIIVQYIHSQVKYPNNFNTTAREIQLKGEAWFNVTPNPGLPFTIHVGDIRVVVLGTSFNISEDSSHIEVSVKTGSIMMLDDADTLIVKAGQKGTYSRKDKRFMLKPSFNANDQGYATKMLNFENIPLKEIAAQIEKAYGVTIVFQNDSLKNLTMSSSFDNNSITYIFDVISITLHVKYNIENKTVYIRSS